MMTEVMNYGSIEDVALDAMLEVAVCDGDDERWGDCAYCRMGIRHPDGSCCPAHAQWRDAWKGAKDEKSQ